MDAKIDGDDHLETPPVRVAKPSTGASTALNPLLRSLLTWGLVDRTEYEDGSRRWELTEAAQLRLDELVPARRSSTSSLAYLDHFCAGCRQPRLTHLRDGRYLCEGCERSESARHDPPSGAPPGGGREAKGFRKRQR